MSVTSPLWITEADVVGLMHLPAAIAALEEGLKLEASGAAQNMPKTHATFGKGDTLHAIGATFEGAGFVGTKTWAHTEGGATPLLILWDAHTGALKAIIEAFAMGQMRTGAMSGVATKWMAAPDADDFALIGTGKQAMTQLAAVAAVRPLKRVRVFGRDAEKRAKFAAAAARNGFPVREVTSVAEAVDGASIVTLVTRARSAILNSAMVARGAHINAIGAIVPEREEFTQDLFPRAGLIAADDVGTTRKLSKEFRDFYGLSDAAWSAVTPISRLVAQGKPRAENCDVSIFKAMGMGISDLALGMKIYAGAVAQGVGRALEPPRKIAPRLTAGEWS
jgi:ornithine cyclodeaminase